MEWAIEGICNCSPQDPSEVQAVKGLSEGHDPRIPIDVNTLLVEGKGVGKVATDITRDVVLSYATTKGASFHKGKTKARSAARKQLEQVLQNTHVRLVALVDAYKKKKKAKFNVFKKDFKSILKSAYYRAYELGLKSTGSSQFLVAGGNKLILPADRKWVESAFRQEMRYLNRFLTDIKLNRVPGRWPHRIGMYVSTVGSIYYTGRVAVTPPNHALFWIANIDNRICPQCKYMATHSPFTKYNIPITPASGHSRCFINPNGIKVRVPGKWKSLRRVKVGDLVMTGAGEFSPVKRVINEKGYTGKAIKISYRAGSFITSIIVTPDHKFFTKGSPIRADSLEGDGILLAGIKRLCVNCSKPITMKVDTRYGGATVCSVGCSSSYYKKYKKDGQFKSFDDVEVTSVDIIDVENERLYCLEVDGHPSFVINNGLVSHNCLSNCRCSIAVRPVSKEYFARLRKDVSRQTHLRRLKKALS